MIRKYVVYVDMDGVLADFEGALMDRFGFDFNSTEKGKPISKGKVWGKIKHYNDTVEPWFYSLPQMKDAKQLWKFLTDNFANVEILSASGSTPKDAPGQKRAWIGDNFGYDIKCNIVGGANEKAAFASENTILIDDRSRAIDPFVAAGGIGILHTSAANTIAALRVMMKDWE